jgi:hypothetical protein
MSLLLIGADLANVEFDLENRTVSFPEGTAPDSIPGYSNLTSFGPGVVGLTVGPVMPPDPFLAGHFIDTLLSYTRQSVDLGWLASKDSKRGIGRDDDCDNDERPDNGVAGNIERRLEIAKRELSKGDSVSARRDLERLLSKIERVWKRSQDQDKKRGRNRKEEMRSKDDKIIMTSEAYALLKYNLEYLIDRMPERERREKIEKGEVRSEM